MAQPLESVFKAAPLKYREETGEDEPCALAAWTYAFAKLDARRLKTESKPPVQYSTFPLPSTMVQATPDRRQQYLQSWLHIRPYWMGQMRYTKGRALALRARSWRDTLHFGLGGPAGPHTTIAGKNMASIQEDFKDANLAVSDDGRIITFDNGEQLFAKNSRVSGTPAAHMVSWQGVNFNLNVERLPGFVQRQVLWELHELNFRFDLCRLDAAMSAESGNSDSDSRIRREDRLSRCWGDPHGGYYDPVDIDWVAKDVGLASKGRDRLPYLRSLYAVCQTWPEFLMPHGMSDIERHGIQLHDIDRLEKDLICAIEQTFFDLFARPMVAPRRLFADD